MDKTGQWVHSVCYLWIPEIFTVEINKQSLISLTNLDKKRYKLKCSLCSTKGACIQCHYGRCATAAHPWCVFHRPQGFTKRVIKDENGELVYEIFCKNHAYAVTEPYKPKSKAKQAPPPEPATYDDALDDSTVAKGGHRKSDAFSSKFKSKQQLSMQHMLKFFAPVRRETAIYDKPSKQDEDEYVDLAKRKSRAFRQASAFDDEDDADSEIGFRPISGKAPKMLTSTSSGHVQDTDEELSFPVFTLSEWPGQAEGEVLDMDHFWNVVSMMYVEDHSPEVCLICWFSGN